eukprot:TRINITY_DN81_c0_g1_i11.p1 TRINITY_DN81_c0_g1~~TRINITY_DN81_c0_g1_i11.p1  ORF type:complete len:223 (+),score=62.11 TRINITY_DN81_c0_g1_i11:60-671(+)
MGLELQSNFAQALGIPPQFVDVEITEDDFLVKIDFTAKSEGAKLAPLNDKIGFHQTFENQVKNSNPMLAAILGFAPPAPIAPIVPVADECPKMKPSLFGSCVGSARCEYGKECCCGVCHTSLIFQCMGGTWSSYYTDACMVQTCHPDAPKPIQMKQEGELCGGLNEKAGESFGKCSEGLECARRTDVDVSFLIRGMFAEKERR